MSLIEEFKRSLATRGLAPTVGKSVRYVVRSPELVVTKVLARTGFRKARRGYQDERFPEDQYELISRTDEYRNASSSLEIGCNQGRLVQSFSGDGLFAVGVDVTDHWAFAENGNAILGVYPMSAEKAVRLPRFDIVCVLSVHHQWVRREGDDRARDTIAAVLERARLCMFIEFAALADKYGYSPGSRFVDNDEESVRRYAEEWLGEIDLPLRSSYLGRTREMPPDEPYRLLFKLSRG